MADIHIGRMSRTGKNKRTIDLFYHIPLDAPKEGIVPTPESSIAGQLEQDEIDSLAAGTLVEVPKEFIIGDDVDQAEIIRQVKVDWFLINNSYNRQYGFEYKLYGMTLNASS